LRTGCQELQSSKSAANIPFSDTLKIINVLDLPPEFLALLDSLSERLWFRTGPRVIDCFDQWGSACAAVMTPATPQKGDGVETMSQPSAAVSAGCNTMLAAVEEALGVRRRRLYHNAMEAWAR
jgi:hypothetical protein